MSNFLVLDSNTYHAIAVNTQKLNEQLQVRATIPMQILPSRILTMLNVVAVVGDSCVEFLKNRYTGDNIMSLEDFETFKQEYLK